MFFLRKLFKKNDIKQDDGIIPEHIAIIMDGNGRWAKKRGLPRRIGHREGAMALKRTALHCNKIGIKYLTVYAFSTENWKRPKEEVDALMELFVEFLDDTEKELSKHSIRISFIGDLKIFSYKIQQKIRSVQERSNKNTGLHLNIAINYGGRNELILAVKSVAEDVLKGVVSIDKIDDELFSNRLYTAGIPEPDLMIRTSGEKRISNFLLWQLAYSEFWFPEVLWPDFGEEHIRESIVEYRNRQRRYGGI